MSTDDLLRRAASDTVRAEQTIAPPPEYETTTVTYTLAYRLTGPLYAHERQRRRELPVTTDAEAIDIARMLCDSKRYVGDTIVKVDHLTKTTVVSRSSYTDLTPELREVLQ